MRSRRPLRWPLARGTLVGIAVGGLAGAGATVSSFVSYGLEKQFSKTPELFGRGHAGALGAEVLDDALADAAARFAVVRRGHGEFQFTACKPTIYVHCCCCFQPTVANARAKLFFQNSSHC